MDASASQQERKTGPEALASNPWLCPALPKLAESGSIITHFRTAGDIGANELFLHEKMKAQKGWVPHVPPGPVSPNSCSGVLSFLQGPSNVDISDINEVVVRGHSLDQEETYFSLKIRVSKVH